MPIISLFKGDSFIRNFVYTIKIQHSNFIFDNGNEVSGT